MRIGSVLTHSGEALFEGLLIGLMVVVLMAGTAFAARGGGGGGHVKPGGGTTGSGTIDLKLMDGATEATFGARVTFTINTSTTYPYVHLQCFQDGGLVEEARTGFFATAIGNEWFYLGPTTNWVSGAADCTAKLESYGGKSWSVLSSTSFHVNP